MGGLGAPELIIILVVVLLLFGSTRLPKLARSLGQASKEFKDGIAEGARDDAAKEATKDAANKDATQKDT
ncbi:MAG: sec-independent protein translocase protein TatA [Actinomycetota bacterium]|jgi:sec-independent protein translocase protein TatA